jgi:uncharacterized protein (DUF39 family)
MNTGLKANSKQVDVVVCGNEGIIGPTGDFIELGYQRYLAQDYSG